MCCPNRQPPGLSAPGTDPRRCYLIKMEPRWKTKISEFLEMIPPLRGGDFQGIAGLSSDDSLLVGVNSARAKFYQGPRAVKHRLDEPGQIIPQHGCVPAWPASVSPGSGNFSRKPRSLGAAQNQASVIAHRGWKSSSSSPLPVGGEVFFLTFPFIDRDFSSIIDSQFHISRR
jgi:hypothetical protein